MARRKRFRELGSIGGRLKSDKDTLRTSLDIKGLSQLKTKLDALAHAVRRSALREAGLHALDLIADEARSLAPVGATGRLKASVRVDVGVTKNAANLANVRQKYLIAGGSMRGAMGADATHTRVYMGAGDGSIGDVFYALFVEYGTVKMAAQPFMRPAVDNRAAAALKEVALFLELAIKRAAAGGGRLAANDNRRFRLVA